MSVSEQEKIRSIASVIVEARKRKWGFLLMGEFSEQVGLNREYILKILELFKEAKIFHFWYLPSEDGTIKQDIFNREEHLCNPRGGISFSPPDIEELKRISPDELVKMVNIEKLQQIVESDEAYTDFLVRASYSPVVSYDPGRRILRFKEWEIRMSGGNQHILCATLFAQPLGYEFDENEIAEQFELEGRQATTNKMHNTKHAINLKFERITGIADLIRRKSGKVWAMIDPLLQ